jgi:hypothetical protein
VYDGRDVVRKIVVREFRGEVRLDLVDGEEGKRQLAGNAA